MSWSWKERMSGSRHSIASLSTCPTAYSISESEPSRSIADGRPSRHSLNLEGREKGFKFGIKHAISRIPSLRRRKGSTLSSPLSITRPEYSLIVDNGVDGMRLGNSLDISFADTLASKSTLAPIDEGSLRRSLESPDLKSMRAVHEAQVQSYLVFRKAVLKPILRNHSRVFEERKRGHIKAVDALVAQNSQMAIRIEENDLVTELALMEEFKREKQTLRSRIRHMEAYFNTPRANDTDPLQPPREYGKEYRDRLRQKLHELATIDSLHQSKIKVLRDIQAKRYEKALEKWEQAVHRLQASNEHDLRNLESRCREEKDAAIVWLEAKRARLKARWTFEERIIRRKLEIDTRESFGPLPELSFGDIRDDIPQSPGDSGNKGDD
ncbi:predicted protein [Uncinocarpus reesii 1704]|uniref:Uncharacterized protein n=1 Tax=Uncinocarpus reesii (strain UAMH 1704) TaxID=336963 RepID=C4JL65_UNCRE|nr:uncharacterized protein UREG_00400 [Uncinocarpus reesii 1704]EEP75554.1 predicted protein [Uncinocarpus reesii 1704]